MKTIILFLVLLSTASAIAQTNYEGSVNASGTFTGSGSGLTAIPNSALSAMSFNYPTNSAVASNTFLAGPVSGSSTAAPTYRAMVAADVPGGILNTNQLDAASKLIIDTKAPTNSPTLFNAINSGTFTAKANTTNELAVAQGGVTISGSATAQLLISSGTTPTIVTNAGAGGGTGTITVSRANSLAGSISLTTGSTTPPANAVVFTLTFASALANTPKVFFIPTSSTAGAAFGTGKGWISPSTTGFTLNSNGSGLTAATTYTWDYFVIQ